jgi:hypothetical protein
MTTISLRVFGLDKLQIGFNQYAKTVAPICRDTVYAAIQRAVKKSPGYLGGNSYTTPERPGQGYVRTGNLGRSVALEQDGLSSRVNVNSGYETYVIGNADGTGQAWMHAGRWPTLRSAVDDEVAKLTSGGELDAALGKSAKEAGL